MPRLSVTGRVVAGNGGPVSLDGVVVSSIGTSASWLDEHRIIWQDGTDGRWTIKTLDTRTGEIVTVSEQGCNELAAGGGRWAAWLAGRGVYGSLGSLPYAGLSPVGTDGRGAAGPDGTIALVPDRQAGTSCELHAPSGAVYTLPLAPYGLQVLGPRDAVWTGSVPGLLPGATNPHRVTAAGRICWLYWTDSQGLVVHPDGDLRGHILEPLPRAFHVDAVVVEGRLVVAYSTGVQERPGEIVVHPNAWDLPLVDLNLAPVVPVIGRAIWCGFFAGSRDASGGWFTTTAPQSLPGNCYLSVTDGVVYTMDGRSVAQWIAAEADGNTPEAYAKAIQQARLRHPSLPVIAYVPRGGLQGPIPPAEASGLEAYRGATESTSTFEARIRAAVIRTPTAWLIPQAFSSNSSLHPDLGSIPPVIARIARDYANVAGILAFSGSGRASGLNDHPEIAPLWEALAAGIPSAPPIVLIEPPIPPPIDPPSPVDPPPPSDEDTAMPVVSDEVFNQYIDKAGIIIEGLLQQVGLPTTLADAKQGARGAGDRYRKRGVNADLSAMVWGAVVERLSKKHLDAVSVLDPLVDKIVDAQQELPRR